MVYDITKEISFKNVRRWIEGIKEHAAENVVIVIVGNKSDLRAIQVVSTSEGKSLAKEMGCFFEESSALTGDNVESTFHSMLEGTPCTKSRDTKKEEAGVSTPGSRIPLEIRAK